MESEFTHDDFMTKLDKRIHNTYIEYHPLTELGDYIFNYFSYRGWSTRDSSMHEVVKYTSNFNIITITKYSHLII